MSDGGLQQSGFLYPSSGRREASLSLLEQATCACFSAGLCPVLQGHIWRGGYEKGELRGAVFEDVPATLADWTEAGSKVSPPLLGTFRPFHVSRASTPGSLFAAMRAFQAQRAGRFREGLPVK